MSKQAADGDYSNAHASTSWKCTASTGLVIQLIFAEGNISTVNGIAGGTQVGYLNYKNYGSITSYAPGICIRVAKAANGTTYTADATTSGNLGVAILYLN